MTAGWSDLFSKAALAIGCGDGLSTVTIPAGGVLGRRDRGDYHDHGAEVLKGKISVAMYVVAMGLAYVRPWLGLAVAGLVNVMWIVPALVLEHRRGKLAITEIRPST